MKMMQKLPLGYLILGLFGEFLEYFLIKSLLIVFTGILKFGMALLSRLSRLNALAGLLNNWRYAAFNHQKKLKKALKQVEAKLELKVEARTTKIRLSIPALSTEIAKDKQAQEVLLITEEKYRFLINNIQDVIFQTDAAGSWIFLSPAWTEITKFTLEETLGTHFLNYLHPDDIERNYNLFQSLIEGKKESCHYKIRYRTKDGKFRWMKVRAHLNLDEDGNIIGTSGFLSDITEYKQLKQKLKHLNAKLEQRVQEHTSELRDALKQLQNEIAERKRAEEELAQLISLQRATLEAAVDGILVVNRNGKITCYNQRFFQMWHLTKKMITAEEGINLLSLMVNQLQFSEIFIAKIKELYAEPEAESFDIIEFKDGRIFERYSQPQRIGEEIVGRVWIFRDITERQIAENMIRYQALHDLLTDLPNRILFNNRLSAALANIRGKQLMLAVMFLDLDRFKTINDTLGHAFGDQLLQIVSERLTGCLWQHDTVARWGGDEFTILLPQINCVEDANRIAQRILDALKQPINIDGRNLHITSSIGIACYPRDGEDGETLLRNADVALYRAKEQGCHNYQLYNSTMNSQASELLSLENELHLALEREEFVVYYQPQVHTPTGKITQMEALVRWRHSDLGLVSPGKFIPLAEENGLIIPIGEWVMRTACAQTKAWQDEGFSPLSVAVNLSACQFKQPNLVEMVARILAETGLEARFLELEITESVAMQNVGFSKDILTRLHNMGVLLSMDDFGTGYSSLSYLKKFPLHKLKIDQSFVRELTDDPNDAAIITAIAALGKELNLKIVAEGVETEEQKIFLQKLECDYMQGYLFSKPVSTPEATQLLQKARSIINTRSAAHFSVAYNAEIKPGWLNS